MQSDSSKVSRDAAVPAAPIACEPIASAEEECEALQCKRERRALEQLLNAAQSEYQTIFRLAAIGIAHIGPDGRFLRANPFFCNMLGYTCDELVGRSFQDATYPEDRDKDANILAKMLEGELPSYALEKRCVRKDSTVFWAHVTASLVRDQYGRPDYLVVFAKNIDQRKRAVEELERSRERIKAVLNTLTEAVFVFDHEGELLEANAAALNMFQYERASDISGRPDDLARAFDAFDLSGNPVPAHSWPIAHLLRGQSVNDVELVIRRKGSGNQAWIGCFRGWLVAPYPDERPLLVLTVQDVTARKQAERAARVGRDRLRLAFDNVPDAILIYDRDLRVQEANKALLEETGLERAEVLGKRDDEVRARFFEIWQHNVRKAFSDGVVQQHDLTFSDGMGMRSLSVACVPLVGDASRVQEVMVICHDYTERERAEERARHAAMHDSLTGLPHRALLFEYVQHAIASARRNDDEFAVAFIDLDRFKPINDTYGHAVGDSVLREVAARLQAHTRGQDLVFRLGGDEFLVLLTGLKRNQQPEIIVRHLLDALNAPYRIADAELSVSGCIGISVYPHDSTDIDTLISQADAAMYKAKQEGRGHICLYTEELAQKMHSKLQIEDALKKALRDRKLCLHYQPLVNTHTSEVVALEALVRMTNSAVSPEFFVPIAETCGLIGELSHWVLEEICEQLDKWKKEGVPCVPVALNVSARQFRSKVFIESLVDTLRKGRLQPGEIQIELTETAVMEDIGNAAEMLHRLREEGVKISLDDFGTGYSSLNYLSQLPIDKIKVDKSFVHRLLHDSGSRAVTASIIALGRALELKIVAEGIESEEELRYLRERGCDEVQGYYISMPIPGSAYTSWYRGYSSRLA